MSMGKSSKMLQFVNWKMRVTIQDSRVLVGTFMAFDKHMNIVLSDCEEYRKVKGKKGEEKEEKRPLGLVLLRGENVVSLSPEAPPLPKPRADQAGKGPGVGRAAGRGMPPAMMNAPAGLTGPVRGIGGPAASMMMPGQGRGVPPPYAGASPMPGMPGRGPPGMPPMPMMAPGGPGRGPPGPPGPGGMPPMPGGPPGAPPMMGRMMGGPPPPMMGRGPPMMGGPPMGGMPPGFPPQVGRGPMGGPPGPMPGRQ